ncbi:MAG: hypothetical protein AAGI09_10665 [Pseudomonadota bacterium]
MSADRSDAPLPVSLFWYQTDIPPQVQRCLDSWSAHPGLRAQPFTLAEARAFLDSACGPEVRQHFETCGPFAMASDVLRMHLMRVHGGLYVDANWAQIQPIRPLLDRVRTAGHTGLIADITELSASFEDPFTDAALEMGCEMLLNGFLYTSAPGDLFLTLCAEINSRNIAARNCEQIAFAAGSGVMSMVLLLRNFETRAQYLDALQTLGGIQFFGKDVRASLETVADVTGAHDHGRLREAFARIATIPGPDLEAYLSRDGLGQTHKDHWTRHKGSLYRD